MSRGGDARDDLLFGLLALQTGLIDQSALVAAFHAWTYDKGRPIAEILVEQGDLDGSQRALIDGLVDQHRERPGGRPEEDLAGLLPCDSTAERLSALGDADLDDSLARALASRAAVTTRDGDDRDADATRTFQQAAPAGRPRFRVLRRHAGGGMGDVFVAIDEELHREVALKQIHEKHADDSVHRARFGLEAEITGGLEHPGIVPVYALGAEADGRPYYAMRFIRGDTLKGAVAAFHMDKSLRGDPTAKSLALRELLRRFQDVCRAIDYAHDRAVLHRDLKPGNIMVGKYGETLVVDWGLAKATGRADPGSDHESPALIPTTPGSASATLPGSKKGTPAYMSPEQARGEPLDASSDVYSLGATLYFLLTNKAPFRGRDADAILADVQSGRFPAPREVRPDVDAGLEAICLKAMKLRPSERYGSARELADDLSRWLADEPTKARRDPPTVRAARWARKHRPIVAGIAAMTASTVAGLIVYGILIGREKARTEANFATARRTLNTLIRQVAAEGLASVPGAEGLRMTVGTDVVREFEQFLRQRPRDPALRSDAADAHREVANFQRLAGRFDDSEKNYGRSLDLLQSLIVEFPAREDYRHRLAAVAIDLGELFRMSARPEQAEARYEAALVAIGPLLDRTPGDPDLRRTRASALLDLSAVRSASGDGAGARALCGEVLAILSDVADAPKAPPATEYLRIFAILNSGTAYRDEGDRPAAEAKYGEAIGRIRATSARFPRERDPKFLEAAALIARSELLADDPARRSEALREAGAAMRIFLALTDGSPLIPHYRLGLAQSRNVLGSCLAQSGQIARGKTACQSARAILEQLIRSRDLPEYRGELGFALGNLGRIALAEKDLRAARILFDQARREQGLALKAAPKSPRDRRLLARHEADARRASRP